MDHDRWKSEVEQIVLASYPDLLRQARALSGNDADARDLTQETVARALSRIEHFRSGTSAKHWLSTILRNIFIDRCRHTRVRGEVPLAIDPPGSGPDDERRGPDAWEAFTVEDVRRSLMFLNPEARKTFSLFTFDRLSFAEISRKQSISIGTVGTRIYRARQQLRQVLISGDFRLRSVQPVNLPGQRAGHAVSAGAAHERAPDRSAPGHSPGRAQDRSLSEPASAARVNQIAAG